VRRGGRVKIKLGYAETRKKIFGSKPMELWKARGLPLNVPRKGNMDISP
jgi:hypothetical protein